MRTLKERYAACLRSLKKSEERIAKLTSLLETEKAKREKLKQKEAALEAEKIMRLMKKTKLPLETVMSGIQEIAIAAKTEVKKRR